MQKCDSKSISFVENSTAMESVIRCLGISLIILGAIYAYEAHLCPTNLSSTTVYITDPENCRNYWICNGTVQKKMKCPMYQCFDTSIRKCSYKDVVNCTSGEDALFPDCNNCTRYWQCSNGANVHRTCPDQLWFNYVEDRCDYIRNYPIHQGCGDIRCTEGPDRKKYRVDHDKEKFVWCLQGRAFLYTCHMEGRDCFFDFDNQLCKCVINSTEINNFIVKDSYSEISHYILKNLDDQNSTPSICRNAPLLEDL